MKLLIVVTFISMLVVGQCAMEYKVHDYLVRHSGQPHHQDAILRNQTPNYQLHGGVNQTYDVHKLFDIEEWRKDLENARQAGPDQLRSFIDTVTEHRKQATEHYMKVKQEAHNQANEFHQALEQLKHICHEAEKELELKHGGRISGSGYGPMAGNVAPTGFINPVNDPNMRDQHRHVTDSERVVRQHDQGVQGHRLHHEGSGKVDQRHPLGHQSGPHIPDHQHRAIPDHVHPPAPEQQAQPARNQPQGFFNRMFNVLMANE